MVAKSTQAWHGGCTKSAGFEAVFPQNHQVPWLLHKAKAEGSTWRRQDPGASASFEVGDTRRDREACVEGKQECSRCVSG
jgi:hypothetical protein